jgi:DNA-binding transcriptional LysR family regulator
MPLMNLAALDLNLLVVFEAIYREQSVTAAAHHLHLGQPAVSAALGRLRQVFNDELFIRIGRSIQPTAKAHELAPGIGAALQQIRFTLESSQTFDPATTQQSFAIGSSDYTSAVIGAALLHHCDQHAPAIDFRTISYEKDRVEALLEQRQMVIALGTFQDLPRQTLHCPLMQEHFVGIARKHHPALREGSMSLDAFVDYPHALFTLRRDQVGAIDRILARLQLQRRIIFTTPYLLVLPSIIARSDTVAAVPFRLAQQFADQGLVDLFELPVEVKPWMISMIWSKLTDQDQGCRWLRGMIQEICASL